METWRLVPGFEDYEVSDLGRVRSWKNGKWGRGPVPKVLKPRPSPKGYGYVSLREDGVTRQRTVHSLVLIAFRGPKPEGHQACHNDGNPANNALSNLRWGTASENQLDRRSHGTSNLGRKRDPGTRAWL